MNKCVVVCLLMMATFYVIPFPPRRKAAIVPYDWEPLGFDYEEPNAMPGQSRIAMEQLYVGEMLTWTPYQVRGIFGYILVTGQAVGFGICAYFLSIRCQDEWLIAGWVRYSTGDAYYYFKYQTVSDGFGHLFSPTVPEVGRYIWVNIIYLGGNIWKAFMPAIRFNVSVQFQRYPDEFCAFGKSLDSCNKLCSTFTNLIWWSSESSFNYWGNSFFGTPSEVDIRSDYPYEVKVHEEYYCFSIGLLEAIRKRGRGNFFVDLYIL